MTEFKDQHQEILHLAKQIERQPWVFLEQDKGLDNTAGVLIQQEIETPLQIFLTVLSKIKFNELCRKWSFAHVVDKDYIQNQYKYLIVRYIPVDHKRGRASIAVKIDMKINFVHLGLMEFVCKLGVNFSDFLWKPVPSLQGPSGSTRSTAIFKLSTFSKS